MNIKHWVKLIAITAVSIVVINYLVSKFAPASVKTFFTVS